MGWSQRLIDSSTITDEEVEDILGVIGAGHFVPGLSWSRQQWGWSAECDINRQDQVLIFSGAWFSVRTDLPERFEQTAQARGHDVVLGPRTG